jgi:solute carrier family 27 fatty acid transporter 1/4
MMYDDEGWLYFCDRLGDTYRWRGENVSSIEIEDTISSKLESAQVIVFGVDVPGQEGKAGMAVIIKTNVDIEKLSEDIKQSIPSYARPVFIRVAQSVEQTSIFNIVQKLLILFTLILIQGTFRAQKNKISSVGFDITKCNDKFYYFDLKKQTYLELTKDVYQDIQNSSINL